MNSILKRAIKNALKRSTAAHLFVKSFYLDAKTKTLSIFFYSSNEEWSKNTPFKTEHDLKFRKNEFNLWFFNHSDNLDNLSERELARTTLKMAYHTLPFPEIEKVYFEYTFADIKKGFVCELDVDFCAALISRAEREKKYEADFLQTIEFE